MAIKIHHATQKKATKLGLTLSIVENEVEVYKGDERVTSAITADRALASAIEKLGLESKPAAKKPAGPKPVKAKKAKKVKAEGDEEEDEDAGPATKSIVRKKYKMEYKARGGHSGDELAGMLDEFCKEGKGKKRRVNLTAVKEVADQNGVWQDKYSSLNPGQARMNVGNRLRGLLKAGKPVKVGRQTIQPDVKQE